MSAIAMLKRRGKKIWLGFDLRGKQSQPKKWRTTMDVIFGINSKRTPATTVKGVSIDAYGTVTVVDQFGNQSFLSSSEYVNRGCQPPINQLEVK